MSPLGAMICAMIRAKGPMILADYMELALQHPQFGYYRAQNPLGKDGDFITAPEISQLFGEMIGLWCADLWRQMDKPAAVTLLELGPGRGSLMQDALRATAKIKGFHAAMQLRLLENHPDLRRAQQEKLGAYQPQWLDDLTILPPQPLFLIANEFFDALPIRQFERTDAGWCERLVGLQDDQLALTLSPPDQGLLMLLPESVREKPVGTVHEVSLPSLALLRSLARHIAQYGGAGLIVDYGAAEASGQSTLQAIARHSYADIFDNPGETDLTAHVDFAALRMVVAAQGLAVFGPAPQGDFLNAMGINLRAAQLKHTASEVQALTIDSAIARLTDPAQMGHLFKALALAAPGLQPAGFS